MYGSLTGPKTSTTTPISSNRSFRIFEFRGGGSRSQTAIPIFPSFLILTALPMYNGFLSAGNTEEAPLSPFKLHFLLDFTSCSAIRRSKIRFPPDCLGTRKYPVRSHHVAGRPFLGTYSNSTPNSRSIRAISSALGASTASLRGTLRPNRQGSLRSKYAGQITHRSFIRIAAT